MGKNRRAKVMWPPKETSLNQHEKAAYRYLLYQAMLDIRNLCQSRGSESWNPLEWWRQYRRSRVAGALAADDAPASPQLHRLPAPLVQHPLAG